MSEENGSSRKEALEATLRKRKECSAKSLLTVEKLIEKNVTQEVLLQNVQFINQSSFQDVTDERSIMNMCGYPLCNNELRNIPKHQYRITRTNGTLLLYDTTERKKFCSNICYKASKYLKDQLPSCPLWLIQPKDTQSVKLIPLDCKMSGGGCGEQVNFGLKEGSESSQQLIVNDNIKATNNINNDNDIYHDADNDNNSDNKDIETDEYHDAVGSYTDTDSKDVNSHLSTDLDELANNITLSAAQHENFNSVDNKTILSITKSDLVVIEKKNVAEVADNSSCDDNNKVVSNSSLKDSVSEKFCDINTSIRIEESKCLVTKTSVDNEKTQVVHNIESTKNNKHVDNSSKISGKLKNSKHKKSKVTSDISPMLAAVLRTEQCIREWVSLDTLYFLLGEDKLKNLIEDTCGIDNFQGRTQKTMEDPLIYERYLAICKKLHLLELNESKFDQSVKNESNCNTIGPTQPLPDFERLKEEAKEMEIKVKAFYRGDKQVQFTVKDEKNDEEKRPVSIPLVDQHAQRALRRRILFDHLNRVLPDLLRTLGLSRYNSSNINTDVKTLVDTFTLSAHNITFRPAEWNFVAIVIIKLLSVRDEILNKTLMTERADKYLTLMLMSYEQDSGYLNRLLTWLLYEHTLFNF